MTIKNRTGQDLWFDPNKMLPGEMAVSTDAKKVYVAFAPGDVREFAFTDQIPIVGDITPDKLQEAVNNYLNENPVHAGATEEEAHQIELNRKNIEEINGEVAKTNANVAQLSNPNLFINGNFQIWSNGTEFLDVASGELTSVADRWSVFYNYNNPGMLNITKTEDGLCVAHGSARPIIVTQVLDEETFNSLKGKTLTLSYGIKNTEYTEYTRQIEVSDSDTDRFIFALENSYIELFDGDTLKWAKLEVGTVHTPCVPDSKDAIICKLEKQNKEAPVVLCSGNNTSGNYTEHEINDISEYKMLFLCAMVAGTSRIICSTVIFPNLIAFNSTTIYDVKYQGVSGNYVVHCYFTDNTKCHVSTDDLSTCSYTLIGVK